MTDLLLRLMAVYRLTYLAIHEDGPFELATRWRTLARRGPLWVQEGAGCPLCLSFWGALLVALLPAWAARWLGLAGLFLLWRVLESKLWRTVPTI